ncbi:globin [Neobacillus drentensis]|uniref:globin domain-containing protein n=1 Tax=Neobacillus drentensis TaxID=220684 RepID=UPI002FFF4DB9
MITKDIKGVVNVIEKKLTPFEAIGEDTLNHLIDTFYGLVAQHPDLAPIFPNQFTEIARKQKQFLTQYLGGPQIYTEEHGHPMMRARHLPFPVTPTRAKAWLSCMKQAMDIVGLQGPLRDEFYYRLTLTAQHMINTPDEGEITGENRE